MRPSFLLAATAVFAILGQSARADSVRGGDGGLSSYLKQALHGDADLQYRAAQADLNRDGINEIIVYVTSPDYCGSGGCTMLVLERAGRSFRTRMKATVTRRPIRLLETRSYGWRDIGVTVGGGGVSLSHLAVMRFDGRRYPSNPTLAPAARLSRTPGTILIGLAAEK
jgi:hypothetical protein